MRLNNCIKRGLACTISEKGSTATGRPDVRNVILIISDTLRRDHLGCYADTTVRTQHLTRFAEKCLVFDRAYFMADHGFYLGERGYIGKSLISERVTQPLPLFPEVCHVPLLVYLPGTAPGRIQSLAQPVDLMPTVLDLFGVDLPPTVQGHSVMPVLTGESESVREIAIASPTIAGSHLQIAHPTSRVTVTDGEWLLICGSRSGPVERDETTSMVDSIGRRVTILDPPTLAPHLFNMTTDPECAMDVLPTHPAPAESLHRSLLALLESAGVPEHQRACFQELV
jgi:hypothetical protein